MNYSLHDLDIKIEKYLCKIENGFYIEAGANDGIYQSNTKYFQEKYKWEGLLIEPNPIYYQLCKKNRPEDFVEHAALCDILYNKTTISGYFLNSDINESCMGQTIDENRYLYEKPESTIIEVPAYPLNYYIKKYNIHHIDFFSLDVEGYEIPVLNGLDLNENRPTYILVETSNFKNRQEEMKNYMKNYGYAYLESPSGNDDLFINEIK